MRGGGGRGGGRGSDRGYGFFVRDRYDFYRRSFLYDDYYRYFLRDDRRGFFLERWLWYLILKIILFSFLIYVIFWREYGIGFVLSIFLGEFRLLNCLCILNVK